MSLTAVDEAPICRWLLELAAARSGAAVPSGEPLPPTHWPPDPRGLTQHSSTPEEPHFDPIPR
jgi:hypothetical protein